MGLKIVYAKCVYIYIYIYIYKQCMHTIFLLAGISDMAKRIYFHKQ